MNDDLPLHAAPGDWHSVEKNGESPSDEDECERLRQTVKRLEEERDQYRDVLLALAMEQFTEAELTAIPDEKDCTTLDQFITELEQLVPKE